MVMCGLQEIQGLPLSSILVCVCPSAGIIDPRRDANFSEIDALRVKVQHLGVSVQEISAAMHSIRSTAAVAATAAASPPTPPAAQAGIPPNALLTILSEMRDAISDLPLQPQHLNRSHCNFLRSSGECVASSQGGESGPCQQDRVSISRSAEGNVQHAGTQASAPWQRPWASAISWVQAHCLFRCLSQTCAEHCCGPTPNYAVPPQDPSYHSAPSSHQTCRTGLQIEI
jgi:hypothetical protein